MADWFTNWSESAKLEQQRAAHVPEERDRVDFQHRRLVGRLIGPGHRPPVGQVPVGPVRHAGHGDGGLDPRIEARDQRGILPAEVVADDRQSIRIDLWSLEQDVEADAEIHDLIDDGLMVSGRAGRRHLPGKHLLGQQ